MNLRREYPHNAEATNYQSWFVDLIFTVHFMTYLTRDYADTIDLQNPSSPSAQDHSSVSSRVAEGRIGSHQNQSLRFAEQEARDDLATSPRVSLDHFDNGDQDHHIDIVYDEPDDSMADLKGEDGDIGDEESDDMMDDDMMDKISSSPSIDDGKPNYTSIQRVGIS